MRRALICDFDGTITDVDTGELILSRFAKGDWRRYDELYDEGKMPMEETMRAQFRLVRGTTKAAMVKLIGGSVKIRPGFEELLTKCARASVPVTIVSYGLDFCIEHFMDRIPNGKVVTVYAPRTKVTSDGIRFAFPRLRKRNSANIKDDAVEYYKGRGDKVAYVGDGTSDFEAIRRADMRFAIMGSRLDELCESRGVECSRIDDFGPVTKALTG